jgi:hypothetical protein
VFCEKIFKNCDELSHISWSQNKVVSILTRLRAGRVRNRGSIPGRVNIFSSSSIHPDHLWDPPTSCLVGTGAPSAEEKRHGLEAGHSLPSRADLSITGAIPPLPHMPSLCAQG